MKLQQQFHLIDGTFTPAEASRVLLALVKSKIDYHRLEKHSNQERFGKDPARSDKRLQELAALQNSLTDFLAGAAKSGQSLEIKCRIEIVETQQAVGPRPA